MDCEWTDSKHVRQTSSSYPRCELDTVGVEPLTDVFTERHDVPDAAVSPNVRSCSDTYDCGTALYDEGISVIRTVGRLRIVKGILGKTGVICISKWFR